MCYPGRGPAVRGGFVALLQGLTGVNQMVCASGRERSVWMKGVKAASAVLGSRMQRSH